MKSKDSGNFRLTNKNCSYIIAEISKTRIRIHDRWIARGKEPKFIFMIDDISANLNFQKEPSRVKNYLAKCRKTVNL